MSKFVIGNTYYTNGSDRYGRTVRVKVKLVKILTEAESKATSQHYDCITESNRIKVYGHLRGLSASKS
jgi:hypothetical protein